MIKQSEIGQYQATNKDERMIFRIYICGSYFGYP